MEWQPIETAPRDGTDILLWGGASESDLGTYDPKPYARKAYWCSDANYDDDGNPRGAWLVSDTCYYSIKIEVPTHWMPLPAPPKEAE